MASQAFLQISSIANSDSQTKDDDALQLLINPDNDKETIIHYINGLKKQHSLPVKHILSNYIDYVSESPDHSIDAKLGLYEEVLNSLSPPTTIVMLPFMKTTINLSKIYESKSNFKKAVDLLKTIHTDLLVQEFDTPLEFDKFRIQLNTNIAKNSLKIDQIEDSEAYITRIAPIIPELSKHPQYSDITTDALKTSIRVMVQLGKWQEASSRLLALNNEDFDVAIVKYSILAPSTHLKVNLFNKIVESDHILQNSKHTPLYLIFNKILNKQLIYHDEYQVALDFLLTTQVNDIAREILLSREYVSKSFASAIVESNLIAASQIYENTTIENFSKVLNVPPEFVAEITGDMIREERLNASIDDIDQLIEFKEVPKSNTGLNEWNNHIIDACSLLDKIVDDISFHAPEVSELVLTASE